jgi:hypothetical protein
MSCAEQNHVFQASLLVHYGLSESVETLDGYHTLGVTSENSTLAQVTVEENFTSGEWEA